ncbi:MAG: hypothetical protein TREMPRED_003425 [Tremellales sp. Tagirdzhanova-0007]|nr:MAG: hypothetical protein TREMPRED_003425 [Tremellales sp. Tagirdzhanova-0007]
MRGQGGDMTPAYLSGRVEINLTESANIKEISMNLSGQARVQFVGAVGNGSRTHHFTHSVISHDWSFLEGDKRHTHTLKAGHHSFPFSLVLDDTLPSTISTYNGDAVVSYKLRANVVRSGFASNLHHSTTFTLARSYTPEALEFNQTLEIENTWPGKVMYCLTLPFKAYAAGDDITVSVKFMPIAKGVKVLSIASVLKEYTTVHTRHSSHPDSRVAASVKHDLQNGQAMQVVEEVVPPPSHYNGSQETFTVSRFDSLISPASHPGGQPETSANLPEQQRVTPSVGPRTNGSYFPSDPVPHAQAGPSSNVQQTTDETEEITAGDDEISTSFSIHIPPWTTASHSIHPVLVTHKLKWSCAIANPDGHISELRCALPIVILDNTLLDEARTAGASARGLLIGGAAADEAQRIDLPSYNNHVYDRIAVADASNAAGVYTRSGRNTPLPSPHSVTPPHTLPTSRSGSPTRGMSRGQAGSHAPTPERRSSGFNLLNHLPSSFMPMRSRASISKPILRNSSAAALDAQAIPTDTIQRNAVSFSNLTPERRMCGPGDGHITFATPEGRHSRFHLDESVTPPDREVDAINQVPSYAIASRGFLGGGVVPLSAVPPTYDDSERIMEPRMSETNLTRIRSDTALAQLEQIGNEG